MTLEYIILILTYTSLTISLFLQLICFLRKIENWETIAFTISLLLLVISISLSPLQQDQETTALSTLLSMILISVTTFLDTLNKQKTSSYNKYKKSHFTVAVVLGVSAVFTSQYGKLLYVQNLIVGFLLVSVVISMLIIQNTKPLKHEKHLEKSNKTFAWTFLIILPIYLALHFIVEEGKELFRIDYILYFAFMALAIVKIYDDMQRLSLVKQHERPNEQQFHNYGLTQREKEIAELLFDGWTYQNIADQLFISMPTVKTHASNIYRKCKVKNRNQLTKLLID